MNDRLLYNVSAFMRSGQPIEVSIDRSRRSDTWPVLIKIGPGGEDTIDIHADVENATRLRDALTDALARETVGSDGCGCPITEQQRSNGTSVDGTERVDHMDGCWNA